jgi:hypothetical protein
MTERAWFAPKSVGYGAGWPIAWQGWAVITAFAAGMIASGVLLTGLSRALAFIVLSGVVILICAKTTAGGWRWRP